MNGNIRYVLQLIDQRDGSRSQPAWMGFVDFAELLRSKVPDDEVKHFLVLQLATVSEVVTDEGKTSATVDFAQSPLISLEVFFKMVDGSLNLGD